MCNISMGFPFCYSLRNSEYLVHSLLRSQMIGLIRSYVLVDTGSSLNVLPKKALDRLDYEGLELKPSNIIVRAFDGSKRMVHGEVNIPIRVGSQVFDSTFYVMEYSRRL